MLATIAPRHTAPTLTVLCAALLMAACAPMSARYSQEQLPNACLLYTSDAADE